MEKNEPKETMRMRIEYLMGGIILRVPHDPNVTECYKSENKDEEYKAIGKWVLDWLEDVVYQEHERELEINSFDLEITATCKEWPYVPIRDKDRCIHDYKFVGE